MEALVVFRSVNGASHVFCQIYTFHYTARLLYHSSTAFLFPMARSALIGVPPTEAAASFNSTQSSFPAQDRGNHDTNRVRPKRARDAKRRGNVDKTGSTAAKSTAARSVTFAIISPLKLGKGNVVTTPSRRA